MIESDYVHPNYFNYEIKKSVVLIGLGPHAKRIYMHYFKKFAFLPKLIVELESKKEEVEKYLNSNKLKIQTLYISDNFRDAENLPDYFEKKLLKTIHEFNIKYAIISTEPKAHFAYLKFFLKNNINTLSDKPITSPIHVGTNILMAKKIKEEYEQLVNIYNEARQENVNCIIQCQRRWHEGYRYIRTLLKDCIRKFNIPITQISIYHCDGMWNMPNEFLFRENHPYKYGYGKLFHSGYHFIDLMCWLQELNNNLPDKKTDNIELYSTITTPYDFMKVFNVEDYKRIFSTAKFNDIFNDFDNYKFNEFGELDFYSLIQFKRGDSVITTCNLELLQSGFSRRSWTELPKDTYKSNGRIRHERVNIQIGPLMNIQIHSYQSKEIKDRTKETDSEIGGVEHFDIYVFRNSDLIGGKPFEKITLKDLAFKNNSNFFIGYNEQAREKCMLDFLTDKNNSSNLLDHKLGIEILTAAYKSICNRKKGDSPIQFLSL